MCYDISFSTSYELVSQYFQGVLFDPQLEFDTDLLTHVQAQAHRKYPVVIFDDGHYKIKAFEWGVIPEYMNTPEKIRKGRSSMCNARSEKVFEDKRSYWYRIRKQRCLIPVTGIFEHREVKGWKNKVPYYIRLRERPLFCIPGLYHYPTTYANVETGEVTGTFTLLTRSANPLMRQIHNGGENAGRMPLFLTQELENRWLSPDLDDEALKEIMAYEIPAGELEYNPVFTIRTTKPRPDQKGKLDVFEWPNLPPLGEDEVKENTLF
jgi:putative SOS response-associated peptidase YedK